MEEKNCRLFVVSLLGMTIVNVFRSESRRSFDVPNSYVQQTFLKWIGSLWVFWTHGSLYIDDVVIWRAVDQFVERINPSAGGGLVDSQREFGLIFFNLVFL